MAVAYSGCRTLRVLPNCRVAPTYGFVATSPTKDVLLLQGQEQASLNLPLHGMSLGARYAASGGLQASITRVGRLSLALGEVSWGQFFQSQQGGCASATHLVLRATVGASSLAGGVEQGLGASVGAVGIAAGQQRRELSLRGDANACRSAANETAPPRGCDVPIQLTLIPINGKAWPDEVDAPSCPPGTFLAGGICIPPQTGVPHACRYYEPNDCLAQCGLGDGGSCNSLGYLFDVGYTIARDARKAQQFYEHACRLGHPKGCTNEALLALRAQPNEWRAKQRLEISCDRGEARACRESAKLFPQDVPSVTGAFTEALAPTLPKAPSARKALLERACRGGDEQACRMLMSPLTSW